MKRQRIKNEITHKVRKTTTNETQRKQKSNSYREKNLNYKTRQCATKSKTLTEKYQLVAVTRSHQNFFYHISI